MYVVGSQEDKIGLLEHFTITKYYPEGAQSEYLNLVALFAVHK